MIIELAEKNIITIVRDNLDKFKKINDESIKDAVIQIESALKDYDVALIDAVVEADTANVSNKTDPVVPTEPEKDDVAPIVKEEPVIKEPKSEPVKIIPVDVKPSEKVVAGDVQLSMEVATKLREAALELDTKDKALESKQLELSARNEIIDSYKQTVLELNNAVTSVKEELAIYKKREALELTRQKQQLTLDLIELYANLNMNKSMEDFQAFGLSQLVELRKALEVTLEKKNTPVRETRNSSTVIPVKQQIKEDSTETFEGLFGKNPDMY